MASLRQEVYGPPKIPNTPSKTINNMLIERCGKEHTNIFKAGIAFGICNIFQAITFVYQKIHNQRTPSHSMWMTACGLVGSVIVVAAVLIYQIMMMSAFLVHYALYMGTWALSLFAVGLCVSGMVFFDKEGGSSSPQYARSTAAGGEQSFTANQKEN